MARITPKTNWVGADIPVAPDFNRIENNNEQAFAEIDQEVFDRQSAITVEQNARISADNTLQTNINSANNARISGDNAIVSNLTSWGAVNSYAMMSFQGTGTIFQGDTLSGASLRYSNGFGDLTDGINIPPGTWRCMGICASFNVQSRVTLFVRIS
jgi:hypothetical protein